MLKQWGIAAATLLSFTTVSANAAPTVIDFEGIAAGTIINGLDLGGVTLNHATADIEVRAVTPGAPGQSISTDPFTTTTPIIGTFNVAGVNSVSIDIGDFNGDPDNIFLNGYDSDNNLIAMDSAFNPGSLVGLTTLSIMASNIAWIEFGGGSQSFPFSVFADNLTFDVAEIPLPGALILLITGIAGLRSVSGRRTA